MLSKNFKFLATLLFLLGTFSSGAMAEGGRIVKWVDSQGVTHYGDKLPAQEAGRTNAEINKQGMVVKRNNQFDNNANQGKPSEADLEAQRKDHILLAAYTKPEEIDLARDRSLQMDQASLQAMTVQRENVVGRMSRNKATAKGFEDRKKPVPAYLLDELKISQAEIDKLDKQIAERKLSMEETRKRFDADKARFISLKQGGSAASSATTSGR